MLVKELDPHNTSQKVGNDEERSEEKKDEEKKERREERQV